MPKNTPGLSHWKCTQPGQKATLLSWSESRGNLRECHQSLGIPSHKKTAGKARRQRSLLMKDNPPNRTVVPRCSTQRSRRQHLGRVQRSRPSVCDNEETWGWRPNRWAVAQVEAGLWPLVHYNNTKGTSFILFFLFHFAQSFSLQFPIYCIAILYLLPSSILRCPPCSVYLQSSTTILWTPSCAEIHTGSLYLSRNSNQFLGMIRSQKKYGVPWKRSKKKGS